MNPYNAAKRGARLLDSELPRWAEIVDPWTLDLEDCFSCVLGQVFGDYEKGASWLERVLCRSRPAFYGFDLDYKAVKGWDGEDEEYYAALDEAWKDEIAKRLSADNQPVVGDGH